MNIFNYWKKHNKKSISDKKIKISRTKGDNLFQKIIIYLSLLITITFVLSINIFSDKIILKEGQISSKDILALESIKFIDLDATQNIKELASKSIKEVYDLNLANIEKVENQVNDVFIKIKEYKNNAINSLPDNQLNEREDVIREHEYNYFKEKAKEINTDFGLFLNENHLRLFLRRQLI